MSIQLDALTAQVANTKGVVASAVVAFNKLAALIVSLKDDPAAIQALADDLQATSDSLAAAVAATPTE